MSTVLYFFAVVFTVFAFIALAKPSLFIDKKTGKQASRGALFSAGMLFAVPCAVVASCTASPTYSPETDPSPAAQSAAAADDNLRASRIKALSPNFDSVTEDAGIIKVVHFNKNVWDEKSWNYSLFLDAKNLIEHLPVATGGAAYEAVEITAFVGTVDNIGREGKAEAMKITYPLAVFEGANWGNVFPPQMMELPSAIAFGRIGRTAALEWCVDGNNSTQAPRFCRAADRI